MKHLKRFGFLALPLALSACGGLGGGEYGFSSYALVRVPGVGDVRAFASNQEIGKTNRGGNLLLPDLPPIDLPPGSVVLPSRLRHSSGADEQPPDQPPLPSNMPPLPPSPSPLNCATSATAHGNVTIKIAP